MNIDKEINKEIDNSKESIKEININVKEIDLYINNRLMQLNKESISLQQNQDYIKLEIDKILQPKIVLNISSVIDKTEKARHQVMLTSLQQQLNLNNTKLIKLIGQITEIKILKRFIETMYN
ncbi:MAG: hypothetical protein WC934_14930 [Acidithiobacillus sp.]|jgi:hypothetical protein|uniref:hypothetical protein n=1 Tax=Acidithiobacillus sp. TaxID=1872118 RepID=UPI00355FEA4E